MLEIRDTINYILMYIAVKTRNRISSIYSVSIIFLCAIHRGISRSLARPARTNRACCAAYNPHALP